MPRKKLENIYKSRDYGASQTNGPPGLLSSMFRSIMQRLGVGPEKWGYLMRLYVQDPRNGVPDNDEVRGSTRGNLSTALSNDYMTWKVFCRGLKFLRIMHVRIVLELYTEDGKKEIISKDFNPSGSGGGDTPFSVNDLQETLKYVIAEECGEEALNELDEEQKQAPTESDPSAFTEAEELDDNE
jgi:hypothetical protein